MRLIGIPCQRCNNTSDHCYTQPISSGSDFNPITIHPNFHQDRAYQSFESTYNSQSVELSPWLGSWNPFIYGVLFTHLRWLWGPPPTAIKNKGFYSSPGEGLPRRALCQCLVPRGSFQWGWRYPVPSRTCQSRWSLEGLTAKPGHESIVDK